MNKDRQDIIYKLGVIITSVIGIVYIFFAIAFGFDPAFWDDEIMLIYIVLAVGCINLFAMLLCWIASFSMFHVEQSHQKSINNSYITL